MTPLRPDEPDRKAAQRRNGAQWLAFGGFAALALLVMIAYVVFVGAKR